MTWLFDLERRAGPLARAARSFVDAQGMAAESFPPGADGMSVLARWLDAYCRLEDPGDQADSRFVEGGGALLGLLLLEHLGGHHVRQDTRHLVQLGTYGCFDPFSAMETALDADSPRAALASAIREAEAEAAAERGIGRAALAFVETLGRRRPDLSVTGQRGSALLLSEDIEVDLQRVSEATNSAPSSAIERVTDRLVSLLPGAPDADPEPWEAAAALILPRLVGEDFVASVTARRGTELSFSPLSADVHVALTLRYGDRSRFVNCRELERWRVTHEDALEAAVGNLESLSARTRLVRTQVAGLSLLRGQSRDGLDAARLLLPSLQARLAAELGLPVAIAVPHRDTLLACAAAGPNAAETLAALAADEAARAPHRISATLFVLDGGGLQEG